MREKNPFLRVWLDRELKRCGEKYNDWECLDYNGALSLFYSFCLSMSSNGSHFLSWNHTPLSWGLVILFTDISVWSSFCFPVYDVTRRETFTNLSEIWDKEIELYSTNPDCIKMLVGNKVDKVFFLLLFSLLNFFPNFIFSSCPLYVYYKFCHPCNLKGKSDLIYLK